MGVRQIRPAKVFQAVSQELSEPILKTLSSAEPPWYKVMGSIPPSANSIRDIPTQHRPMNLKKSKKFKKMFKPQAIKYEEDALRTTFYKDHPWELARPRVVLESDGMDHRLADWSRGLRQPGLPLNGESVVQRQLWLMDNEKMGKRKAYDVTRREFYRLRQEEEVEKRVALEEARHVGAYFGKTRLDVGMHLENREFENWKVWAGKETANREASNTADLETFGLDEAEAEETPEVNPLPTP